MRIIFFPIGLRKETMKQTLEEWLEYFFTFASVKNKDFYWSWDRFMIVVRKEKDRRRVMVLEIFLPDPPFLIQKHIDITFLSKKDLVASLMFFYHHYKSSPRLRRNRENSLQFLSFRSFAQQFANHDIQKVRVSQGGTYHRLLVSYLIKTLDRYDIHPQLRKQSHRLYSLSQLTA